VIADFELAEASKYTLSMVPVEYHESGPVSLSHRIALK
jgi:hypothetical protein